MANEIRTIFDSVPRVRKDWKEDWKEDATANTIPRNDYGAVSSGGGLTLTVGIYDNTTIVDSYIEEVDFIWETSTIDWGDGSSLVIIDEVDQYIKFVHEYPDTGTYTMTVTERNGGVPTGRTSVSVLDLTMLESWGESPYAASGLAISEFATTSASMKFFDTSNLIEPATSWLWDFDDGEQSTLQNPTHQYTTPGSYQPTLAVNGGDPINVGLPGGSVGSITVIATPTFSTEVKFADAFTGDGPIDGRVPTTVMADVFDVWDSIVPDADFVTLNGSAVNLGTDSVSSSVSQLAWQEAGPVTPPPELQEFVFEFDFTFNSVPPEQSATLNVYLLSQPAQFTQHTRASLDLTYNNSQPEDGVGSISASIQVNLNSAGSGSAGLIYPGVDIGDTIHVKIVDDGTFQYLFLNDVVTRLSKPATVEGPVNGVNITIPHFGTGPDQLDNLQLSAITV